jgi:hypothetical protein
VAIEIVPFTQLRWLRKNYVRDAVSDERVGLFASLYQEGNAVEPIEGVRQSEGTVLVADGVHRAHGILRAGLKDIEVRMIAPEPGESPQQCAYRRSLAAAIETALPLNREERRRAATFLKGEQPQLSNRDIARLVGVAHSTVDRWMQEEVSAPDEGLQTHAPPVFAGSQELARRLVGSLAQLDRARGLLDHLAPRRMAGHLARAFEDRFGADALAQAERFAGWLAGAVESLQEEA